MFKVFQPFEELSETYYLVEMQPSVLAGLWMGTYSNNAISHIILWMLQSNKKLNNFETSLFQKKNQTCFSDIKHLVWRDILSRFGLYTNQLERLTSNSTLKPDYNIYKMNHLTD